MSVSPSAAKRGSEMRGGGGIGWEDSGRGVIVALVMRFDIGGRSG